MGATTSTAVPASTNTSLRQLTVIPYFKSRSHGYFIREKKKLLAGGLFI